MLAIHFSALIGREVSHRELQRLFAADQTDHHALDDQFAGGDQIRERWVFRMEERLAFVRGIAFQSGFTVDEGRDDITLAGRAFFQNDGITGADVSIDHRLTGYFQREGLGGGFDAEGCSVHGKAALGFRFYVLGHARSDAAVDRNVNHLTSGNIFREHNGPGFVGETLDDLLTLEGA